MRKRLWLTIAIATFVAFAMLFVVLLPGGSRLSRKHYEVLLPGITEAEIDATIGFAGDDVDGPPLPALRGKGTELKLIDYRWKRWQSRGSELRVGFGAKGGLRWKCWIERDPASTSTPSLTSIETAYAEDGTSTTGLRVTWVDQSSVFERWLAELYRGFP